MKTLALAALTMVTALGATGAEAQRLGDRPGASYPAPGAGGPMVQQPNRPHPGQSYPGQAYPGQRRAGGGRWGESIGGHWSGGMNAPGGWGAYRRPSRGYRLPSYWFASNFYIGDYAGYGLYAPPEGYGWQRYYDDAVLVDPHGRVRDSVSGLDWDGGYGEAGGYAENGYGYAEERTSGGGYAQPSYRQRPYAPLPPLSQNGTVTTYSTSSGDAQSGYAGGGYYAAPGTTTVVTIQGAPTVTTTTTEYIEETTREHYVAPRRVYRAPVRHYRAPRPCGCRVVRRVPHRVVRPVEEPVLGS